MAPGAFLGVQFEHRPASTPVLVDPALPNRQCPAAGGRQPGIGDYPKFASAWVGGSQALGFHKCQLPTLEATTQPSGGKKRKYRPFPTQDLRWWQDAGFGGRRLNSNSHLTEP